MMRIRNVAKECGVAKCLWGDVRVGIGMMPGFQARHV
jgi:hypothetical protein